MNDNSIYDLQNLLIFTGCFLLCTSFAYAFRSVANNGLFSFAGPLHFESNVPVIPDAPVTAFRDNKAPDLRQFDRVNYLEMGPLMKKLLSQSHKKLKNWTQTQRLEISPTRPA